MAQANLYVLAPPALCAHKARPLRGRLPCGYLIFKNKSVIPLSKFSSGTKSLSSFANNKKLSFSVSLFNNSILSFSFFIFFQSIDFSYGSE